MQQLLKMTVFCVLHTQAAVLKLEGVKEGKGNGDLGEGRVTQSQLLLSPRLVLLHTTIIHCTRNGCSCTAQTEEYDTSHSCYVVCIPDHFPPTQLRTNNDYDHWCQFEGGTGPRRCPRTSTCTLKSPLLWFVRVCCLLLQLSANESWVIPLSFFFFFEYICSC